jgi:glucan biosynthesis protein C
VTIPHSSPQRRHDLDWLRVAAFGLLILYHVGMFYVTWDWHIKSTHASPLVEPLMALVSPWRLALLFLISGVAVRYALDKSGTGRFLRERSLRLFLPLAFGMAVVVMPQAYFELRYKGEIEPGILAFWGDYLGLPPGPFSIITPTWNHLWYVAYVLVYSVAIALFAPLQRGLAKRASGDAVARFAAAPGGLLLLLAMALPFLAYRLLLDPVFPTTHAMFDDWATHAHFFTMFLIGYLGARSETFWSAVDRHWRACLNAALTLGALIVIARFGPDLPVANEAFDALARLTRPLYAWLVIVALLGVARRWLNRPGPALRYMTDAIFPWYILHQTLIVAIGWWLLDAGLSASVEAALLIGGTVLGCAVGYELIRRAGPLRLLFGLRWREKTGNPLMQPSAALR